VSVSGLPLPVYSRLGQRGTIGPAPLRHPDCRYGLASVPVMVAFTPETRAITLEPLEAIEARTLYAASLSESREVSGP